MFCRNCGKEVINNCIICPNCKTKIGSLDTGNEAFIFLGYCVPLAGFILYFMWKNKKPRTAKRLLLGASIFSIYFIVIYAMIIINYIINVLGYIYYVLN